MNNSITTSPVKMPKRAIDKFIAKNKNKFVGFRTNKGQKTYTQRARLHKTINLSKVSYSITDKKNNGSDFKTEKNLNRSLSKRREHVLGGRFEKIQKSHTLKQGMGKMEDLVPGKTQVKQFRKFRTKKNEEVKKGYSQMERVIQKKQRKKVERSARSLGAQTVQLRKFPKIEKKNKKKERGGYRQKEKGKTNLKSEF
jgi:hypothetical protein